MRNQELIWIFTNLFRKTLHLFQKHLFTIQNCCFDRWVGLLFSFVLLSVMQMKKSYRQMYSKQYFYAQIKEICSRRKNFFCRIWNKCWKQKHGKNKRFLLQGRFKSVYDSSKKRERKSKVKKRAKEWRVETSFLW